MIEQKSVVFPENPAHGDFFRPEGLNSTYFYDRPRKSWIFLTREPEAAEFAKITFGLNPHEFPRTGDLWVDKEYYMYTYDGNAWVGVSANGEFGKVKVSAYEPSTANPGMLWYDSNTSDLKILYEDSDSRQWVSITAMNGAVNITSQEMEIAINNLSTQLGRMKVQVDEVISDVSNTDGLLELD